MVEGQTVLRRFTTTVMHRVGSKKAPNLLVQAYSLADLVESGLLL